MGSGRGVTVVQTFSPGMGAVRVPILSGETAASLARHVTEICRCWRWL